MLKKFPLHFYSNKHERILKEIPSKNKSKNKPNNVERNSSIKKFKIYERMLNFFFLNKRKIVERNSFKFFLNKRKNVERNSFEKQI